MAEPLMAEGCPPRADPPAAEKPEIRVDMTALPELAEAEPSSSVELNRIDKKNKLPNSSFEQSTVPDWPDYYRYMGAPIMPDELIGMPQGVFGVDSDRPYHGEYSLRMAGVGSGVGKGRQIYITLFMNEIDPALIVPRTIPLVLSGWMRASRDGVRVGVYVDGGRIARTNFTLTTEWERYSLPFILPANSASVTFRWTWSHRQEGDVIWMDAIQLEMGEQATEYEP